MRMLLVALAVTLALPGCAHRPVTIKSMLGLEHVHVAYLLSDGRWVDQDSLAWTDRSWYRELRYDTDGDSVWNYLYAEVYDDVSGWTWIPSTARINPEEESALARTKCHLTRDHDAPPLQPSLDDFGYENR